MKRLLIFAILLVALSACAPKTTFPEDGTLTELEIRFALFAIGDDCNTRTIVYNDGKVEIYVERYVLDAETMTVFSLETETEIPLEAVKKIQKAIVDAQFFDLPEDLSTESLDGAFISIKAVSDQKTCLVYGQNPDNKRFNTVRKAIEEAVESAKP